MTTILRAKCTNDKVTIKKNNKEITVPKCDVLSGGTASSDGYLIISKKEFFYLTNEIDNLKKALEIMSDAFNSIVNNITPGGASSVVITPQLITDMRTAIQEISDLTNNLK